MYDHSSRSLKDLAHVSTSQAPPYWEPNLELNGYPLKHWLADISIWSAGTELADEIQAPAVAQRLGGTCRDLVRGIDPGLLRNGRTNVAGDQESGLEVLIAGLVRRHGQYAVETSTTAIIELLRFDRKFKENIVESLSRFETLRQAANNMAGFTLPVPVLTWMLLEAVSVPRPMWPLILTPYGGQFLTTEQEFTQVVDSLRRQGHIAEKPHAGPSHWRERGKATAVMATTGAKRTREKTAVGPTSAA
jgi:hypothetical protein